MSTPTRESRRSQSALKALAAPAGGALTLIARAKTALSEGARNWLAPAPGFAAPSTEREPQTAFSAGRALLISFVLMVALPAIAATVYFAFIASNEYVSETRLTVRAASEEKQASGPGDSASLFSKIGLGGGKSTVQDSYLVLNYLKSRAVVQDIGGNEFMESKYSRPEIDWVARLGHGRPTEDLWKYWNSMVVPIIDAQSGIVTVKVYAFTAQDAFDISTRLVALSERLINRISERSRTAAVDEGQIEVDRAQRELIDARSRLQVFRNQSATIDPVAQASSIGDAIGKLLVDRGEIENSMLTFSGTLAATSPAVRIQKSRLDAIDKQISDLKKQLTSSNAGDKTLSTELSNFEQLKLKQEFAEKKYSTAQQSLDHANLELERKQLFVSLVVEPGLPQYPLFPERGVDILLVFAVGFVSWGILCLISASVLDHFV